MCITAKRKIKTQSVPMQLVFRKFSVSNYLSVSRVSENKSSPVFLAVDEYAGIDLKNTTRYWLFL